MKQNEYLSTIFGAKYKLTTFDVELMAAILAEAFHVGIRMDLVGAPLLWNFECVDEGAVYEVVRQDRGYWGLMSRLNGCGTPADIYNTLMIFMTRTDGLTDLKKVAMILLTEWPEGKEHAERPRQITPVADEAPQRELVEREEKLAHNGWLATGKYPLEVKGDQEGEFNIQIIDLDQKPESDDVPAVAQIARLLRATWNSEGGFVDPNSLEAVTMLLARLFMAERQLLESRLKEATKPAEPVSIWPKNQEHWIFDAQLSALQVAWPLRADYPCRGEIADVIRRAAMFAVSRASGMGNSRIFNIEGFVENVVLGLIGDGSDPKNFDFHKLVFVEKGLALAPALAAQPTAEPAKPARKPRAHKPAVKPTTK